MKFLANKIRCVALLFALSMPMSANAEETKSFWAKLVPDNSTALDFVDNGKAFFGQLFEDGKQTGKALINTGKDVIDGTGETIKSITTGD